MVRHLQVDGAGDLVDAGVARRDEQLVAQRAVGDGPGQRVLAAA